MIPSGSMHSQSVTSCHQNVTAKPQMDLHTNTVSFEMLRMRLFHQKTKDIFKTKISEYRMFHLGKVSHHASQIVFGRSLRFETGATLRREETRSSFNLLRLMFAPFTSDLIDGLFSGCMLFLTRLFNLGVFRI